MKKLSGFILALALCFFQTTASHCAEYWAKTYGGDSDDRTKSIQETTDGGYVIAGYTESFGAGSADALVLKLGSNGDVTWQKTYGGSGGDSIDSIQETADGGYVAAGYTSSFGEGNGDAWVLRLDSNGDVTWQKTYGGSDSEQIFSIQETTDGGYVAAGQIVSLSAGSWDIWVLKLDSNGDVTWQKTYGGSLIDAVYSIQETTDGGYVIAGATESFGAGSADAWVLKLDSNGDVTWQKTYGGSDGERLYSIQETTDGGYVIAGKTESFGAGNGDAWVLKLDSNGDVTWQKTYGGSDGNYVSSSVQETMDGGYIAAGGVLSFVFGYPVAWIIKLDSNGDITWQHTYGGSVGDAIDTVQETTDGGYVAVGGTISFGAGAFDVFVLRLNSNGEIPGCDLIQACNLAITNTSISGQDTNVTVTPAFLAVVDTAVTPQDSSASITTVCGNDSTDSDNDGIPDDQDNCPETSNGPDGGTCTKGAIGDPCTIPADNENECGGGGFCSMVQEDTYPPQGNNIGDACDCESDFNCDGSVDADDVSEFLNHFGRFEFNNPCANDDPCNGDIDCDTDVDAADINRFLEDFGRFQFNNPCPACVVGDWCIY